MSRVLIPAASSLAVKFRNLKNCTEALSYPHFLQETFSGNIFQLAYKFDHLQVYFRCMFSVVCYSLFYLINNALLDIAES